METKKKLRKNLDDLARQFVAFRENMQLAYKGLQEKCTSLASEYRKAIEFQNELKIRVEGLEKEADVITGKQAARMLGWQTDYVSSTFLTSHGIKFTKDDNGCLKISRKDIEEYLQTRETTNED